MLSGAISDSHTMKLIDLQSEGIQPVSILPGSVNPDILLEPGANLQLCEIYSVHIELTSSKPRNLREQKQLEAELHLENE